MDTLPQEYFQTMPPGLDRPLLGLGIALGVIGVLVGLGGFALGAFWALAPCLLLCLAGGMLALVYRTSDGSYHF
jgi:hypothetical protein